MYNLVYDGGDGDGPETARKGVGDEGAEERREGGGAAEIVEGVGSGGEWEVQLACQVAHHVDLKPYCCQFLTYLVCCMQCGIIHARSD